MIKKDALNFEHTRRFRPISFCSFCIESAAHFDTDEVMSQLLKVCSTILYRCSCRFCGFFVVNLPRFSCNLATDRFRFHFRQNSTIKTKMFRLSAGARFIYSSWKIPLTSVKRAQTAEAKLSYYIFKKYICKQHANTKVSSTALQLAALWFISFFF